MKGKLYLIPTTLGNTEPLEVLPISVKKIIEQLNHFIVENEKTARRFIKKITPSKGQGNLQLMLLDKYSDEIEIQNYLDVCEEGISVGILSEAGVPAIADPGASIAKLAHEKGIQVVPLVGPSSILLAMMASGMNGQSFAFNGYLPIDKAERKRAIKQLENTSREKNQSQIFIETPYRNEKMLADLCSILSDHTRLCVACDVTLASEYIKTLPVKNWKKQKIDLHKRPAIFIIHK
ncbi:SAM-dependent methyltransferase [Tenacibaculum sp. C7A-26P2]|uniref:SAM-dependent methyltransferase n=1 Tax=Tenacibaculum sp. C7A-26P2 TaxID=3447504 RepID=UPI003F86F49C